MLSFTDVLRSVPRVVETGKIKRNEQLLIRCADKYEWNPAGVASTELPTTNERRALEVSPDSEFKSRNTVTIPINMPRYESAELLGIAAPGSLPMPLFSGLSLLRKRDTYVVFHVVMNPAGIPLVWLQDALAISAIWASLIDTSAPFMPGPGAQLNWASTVPIPANRIGSGPHFVNALAYTGTIANVTWSEHTSIEFLEGVRQIRMPRKFWIRGAGSTNPAYGEAGVSQVSIDIVPSRDTMKMEAPTWKTKQ